ncbi:MAG: hypothetical protein AB9897_03495 [Anaerolineaceae bacterium]
MANKSVFSKVLATVGAVLVWLPVLAPLVFALMSFFSDGIFRFDYLMPAELFPMILVGAGLLLWAAIRARAFIKPIAWALGSTIALLLISQGVAVATGLASGRIEAAGWPWALTMSLFIGFLLAVLALGVLGVLLMVRLYKKSV